MIQDIAIAVVSVMMAPVEQGVYANGLEHHALYTHCYGHALNLACQDAGIKVMENALDTLYDI